MGTSRFDNPTQHIEGSAIEETIAEQVEETSEVSLDASSEESIGSIDNPTQHLNEEAG
jgi:hypothetical protein